MLQKPNSNDPPIVHLGYNLIQISDEKKEACIHCGNVWYSVHYKDGVCNECQQKKLPGQSSMEKKRNYRAVIIASLLAIFLYFVLK